MQGWTSSQSPSGLKLGRGVSELIRQVFAATERKYGPKLTRAACMLVTFAMEGVTDNEVVDMLSLDEQVMSKDGVNKYNIAERLPSHVWLRLRDTPAAAKWVFSSPVLASKGHSLSILSCAYHSQIIPASPQNYTFAVVTVNANLLTIVVML